MIIKEYEYNGYLLEIHEHPIYHDFEFVVKSSNGKFVKGTSTHTFLIAEDAENAAKILINEL